MKHAKGSAQLISRNFYKTLNKSCSYVVPKWGRESHWLLHCMDWFYSDVMRTLGNTLRKKVDHI